MKTKTKTKTKTTNAKIGRVGGDAGETRAIEVSFHPEDKDRVIDLLERFGGCEGDTAPEEAATRLASMAMFLSNIASGHLRARADGSDRELGMDFIVEGGLASADFDASVIATALWIQGRWERNLLHDPIPAIKGQPRNKNLVESQMHQHLHESFILPKHAVQRVFTSRMKEFKLQREIRQETATLGKEVQDPNAPAIVLMPDDMISSPLIMLRRTTLMREATEFPFFFLRVSGMASLQSRAARAHLGHFIVHSRVESPACLEKLRRNLSGIGERDMSGRSEGSPTVRVNQALCANSKVFDEAVAASRSQPGTVSGLLWLVDSSPGCELPAGVASSPAPNFHDVCMLEIMHRINFSDDHVHILEALNGRLAGWKEFLREQERHLPGIATTAWNLPVALCYGLEALLGHDAKMDGAEVIALAKWLVLRMSNRFAAAAPASQSDDTRLLAEKLAGKLMEHGPLSVRNLTRKCSRLKKDDCQRALGWLSEQGVADCKGSVWGIVCDADAMQERI